MHSHLSDDEREQIGLAKALGHSIGAIARAIGRPKSTISRELSRNKLPSGRYSPLHAAGAYQLRRGREALIERDRALRTFVVDRLVGSGANFRLAEGRKRTSSAGRELRDDLRLHLSGSPKGRAVVALSHASSQTPPATPIETFARYHQGSRLHPRTAQDCRRQNRGRHWEGDLIICKRTRPVLVLHERKSRVTLAARLAGKTAAETISVMLAVFARIEPALRKSITFDNDTAFAQHALLRTLRAMTTWFCDAYASWQKGGVENANGRLRRWLPRQIDIDQVSDEEIQDIVTANLTPRKCLASRPLSRRSSRNLAKTCKSASHSPVALGSRIQAARFFLPKSARRRRGETTILRFGRGHFLEVAERPRLTFQRGEKSISPVLDVIRL